MPKPLALLALVLVISILTSPLAAQDSARAEAPRIVVSGQVRLRSEWDDRHVLADKRVMVHLLRSRLRATARPMPWITVLGEVQDARFLGEKDPSRAGVTTGVYQVFAQVDGPFRLPLQLRLGRQEMAFANERLISASNWGNTGRSFDGARATWKPAPTLSVDAWAERLAAGSAGSAGARHFYGAWATWEAMDGIGADLFALRDDNAARIRLGPDAGRRVLGRSTVGANLRAAAGRVAVELEGAGQTGRGAASDSADRQEIRAWMASVTASAALLARTQTRLGGVFTVLSGDASPGDGRDERFSTLFGTSHRLYGTIDIVPEFSGTRGLVDVGATLAHAPVSPVRLLLEAHRFFPQRGSGAFGSEADLTAAWRAAPPFEVSGGASAFAPGPLLDARLGGSTRYWAYLQGTWEF